MGRKTKVKNETYIIANKSQEPINYMTVASGERHRPTPIDIMEVEKGGMIRNQINPNGILEVLDKKESVPSVIVEVSTGREILVSSVDIFRRAGADVYKKETN